MKVIRILRWAIVSGFGQRVIWIIHDWTSTTFDSSECAAFPSEKDMQIFSGDHNKSYYVSSRRCRLPIAICWYFQAILKLQPTNRLLVRSQPIPRENFRPCNEHCFVAPPHLDIIRKSSGSFRRKIEQIRTYLQPATLPRFYPFDDTVTASAWATF